MQPSPNPTGGTDDSLYGVACSSRMSCTAVGVYNNGVGTLIEAWDGSRWTIQPSPNPGGTGVSELTKVACPSRNQCVAVGDYYNSTAGAGVPLVETWNGSQWTVEAAPHPNDATSSSFNGVSCASSRACTAVGSFNVRKRYATRTLVEEWNGSRWSTQSSANARGSTDSELDEVACSFPSACKAVGTYVSPTSYVPLVETRR